MDNRTVVAALAALAQETRLAAYRLLVQAGPNGLSAGRIAEALAVAPATLSFHLREMSYAGLVASRADGRYQLYTANFEQMAALVAFLTENCCGGRSLAACSPTPKAELLSSPNTLEHRS